MKNTKLLFFLGALFLVLAITLSIFNYLQKPKIAFVNVQLLYNDFTYKKELEEKLNEVKSKRQAILDSLKIKRDLLGRTIENEKQKNPENITKYKTLQEDIYIKENRYIEDNNSLASQYNQQVLKQLNQYVQDYGKAKGYSFVFGATSNGSLMYASQTENITTKVLEYINSRYNGKK